jgi:hypothetical protein
MPYKNHDNKPSDQYKNLNNSPIDHQYNSPIENQINNNIIYISNDVATHKFGSHPYSQMFDDFRIKQSKYGLGSYSRQKYSR